LKQQQKKGKTQEKAIMSSSKLPIHWCKRESQLTLFSVARLKIVPRAESRAARVHTRESVRELVDLRRRVSVQQMRLKKEHPDEFFFILEPLTVVGFSDILKLPDSGMICVCQMSDNE
jgi:hypothetical protein